MASPDIFRQESLVYIKDISAEVVNTLSWAPEASAAGGKAARQEWLIWKATAYKVLFRMCVCMCVSC
jgi:hypothetical protein